MLCVTGAEAMYADLGHFTRISIQVDKPSSLNPKPYLYCCSARMPALEGLACNWGGGPTFQLPWVVLEVVLATAVAMEDRVEATRTRIFSQL